MIKDIAISQLSKFDFLVKKLIAADTISKKLQILRETDNFQKHFIPNSGLGKSFQSENNEKKLVIASILTIGEGPIVFRTSDTAQFDQEKYKKLLTRLWEVESFYQDMGGIVGYHYHVLRLLNESENREKSKKNFESVHEEYLKPIGFDLTTKGRNQNRYVRWGIENLPKIAEIYPIGGAGDRLNLRDENTGEPLPAAELRFCGRTLLSTLIRDLQAKEYLYYKITGEQILTPIAMMTSEEKGNHQRIIEICKSNSWFGRPEESYFLFTQPLVPVITLEGHWSMSGPLELTLKPGGHGVIWKLAQKEGVFEWLRNGNRSKALLRQINNPVAGTDLGILAFCGIGTKKNKVFGFASCPRLLNTAQGMIVLVKREEDRNYDYCMSNIEYTDFSKKGLEDLPEKSESPFSKFPANTNILFVDLESIEDSIQRCPVPGMLVNFKNTAPYIDENGVLKDIKAGRLESTMQNISDCIIERVDHPLSQEDLLNTKTFVSYNERQKTISVTKNSFHPSKPLLETPPGCFYELLQNNLKLCSDCGIDLPNFCSEESYLKNGPNLIFLYHPAVGPLYSIIEQKIRGGKIFEESEIQLEIAEIDMENVEVKGSLIIDAAHPLTVGDSGGEARYSDHTGKCELKNVKIMNKGIDRAQPNVYWKNIIQRKENCHIILRGNAEFIAENVIFYGDHRIEVPEGYRWKAMQKGNDIEYQKEKISGSTWCWKYSFSDDDGIQLIKSKL
jgi:hypothetical protein